MATQAKLKRPCRKEEWHREHPFMSAGGMNCPFVLFFFGRAFPERFAEIQLHLTQVGAEWRHHWVIWELQMNRKV